MAVAGVDLTALIIAYLREVESERADRLFNDPWARCFVDASGHDRPDPEQTSVGRAVLSGASWVSVRTRFIDDAVLDAAADCRDVVLLGAGLDTRAMRLSWPASTTVYEVDTAAIFDFKEPVLREADMAPSTSPARRVLVESDVTGDLRSALERAGLRRDVPTAWIAEGLLLYLTPEENEQLLTTVTALSASGSRFIVTLTPEGQGQRDDAEADQGRGWRNAYRVSDGPADPAAWLAVHGWRYAQPEHVGNLAIRYGRTPAPEDSPELPRRRLLIDARRQPPRAPR